MKTLLQSLETGASELLDAPVPMIGSTSLLVRTSATVISTGTERMLVEFGRANIVDKALKQPDKVRQVLAKIRTDGLLPTIEAVRAKLSAPIQLGYCHAGVVVDAGASVPYPVGTRVATNGSHAEYVAVPHTLAARIPDQVSDEAAAFTPLAAIGLQGLRLAGPTLGEVVVVYGLGLIGLLTVQLLRANGCRVIGIDRNADRLALAERVGAVGIDASQSNVAARVLALTGGVGADAVLLTLASESSEPIHMAAEMSRKRGRIVLVGVTGLELRRDDFFKKELSFSVSCSYGPGRYDPRYEDQAQDYPIGFVRWTEQRNFEAVLGLMAEGKLDPLPLISHRFPFSEAPQAYDLITSTSPSLAVVLDYGTGSAPPASKVAVRVHGKSKPEPSAFCVGVVGAGNFGSRVLIPAIAAAGGRLRIVSSGKGVSAAVAARAQGFEASTSSLEEVLQDPAIDTVCVLTRHDTHASIAVRALEAGKHVFVEKPLALSTSDLDSLRLAQARSGRILTVGFNRRFSELAVALRTSLNGRAGPASLVMTINAGSIPRDHWTQDPEVGGGRIVGEACHFVDLSRYLVGSPIRSASVVTAREHTGNPIDDIAGISILFEDGSTAAIHYLANGSASFPKERIEAFYDGTVSQIDNWRRLRSYGRGPTRGGVFTRQDKGHRQEMRALASAVRLGGPPPIPIDELFEVSDWAVRLAAQARGVRAT